MQYFELAIRSEQIIKKIRIVATDGRSVECEVEHIEGERYKVVTNVAEALELTGNPTTIKILEYE